jgi:hypothetical protein
MGSKEFSFPHVSLHDPPFDPQTFSSRMAHISFLSVSLRIERLW